MPADTYSNTLGVLLMGTGNDNNSWGGNANSAVFQILEDAIANALTNTVTGGTLDLSGSPPPAAASQVRYAALIFNGTLLSAQTIIVPNLTKWWWVQNATSGSFALSIKTTSGSAVAVPQNSGWQLVQCDGANGIVVSPFNSQQIRLPDGSVSAPPFSNVNEPTSGWRRAGTQDWRLTINGVDVVQVTGTGAGTPSIFNVLSPLSVQAAGAQIIPSGVEFPYAGIALPSGGYLWEDGTAYSRTTYANLFAALTKACTGDTNATNTISNVSADLRGMGLVGAYIEGTGIASGTTITAISATTLTMSAAAVGSNVGLSLRILPHGQGDGSTTFNVPDRRERTLVGRGDMNNSSDPGRITLASAGFNPISLGAAGGSQSITIAQANLPNVAFTCSISITDGGHAHDVKYNIATVSAFGGANPVVTSIASGGASTGAAAAISNTTGITASGTAASGGSGTALSNMQPTGVCNYIIKT